nr:MAG TPA: Protein of unknown function (DUF1642) [Caudoviricetes sp.]
MGVQELIEKYKKYENALYDIGARVACQNFLKDLEQLNESETGHADEAPRYVKNILARLRELPLHDREVWLKAIMGEFEQDFSHAKWREGYEQGKFEGEWVGNQLKDADKIRQELNKPVIPQFVADWYEDVADEFYIVLERLVLNYRNNTNMPICKWFLETEDALTILINMHQFGYTNKKEKRYLVKVKGVCGNHETLNCEKHSNEWLFSSSEENRTYKTKFTRKELEEANFGWVFNCPGIEVLEVEE